MCVNSLLVLSQAQESQVDLYRLLESQNDDPHSFLHLFVNCLL